MEERLRREQVQSMGKALRGGPEDRGARGRALTRGAGRGMPGALLLGGLLGLWLGSSLHTVAEIRVPRPVFRAPRPAARTPQLAPLRLDRGRFTAVFYPGDEKLAAALLGQAIATDTFPGLPR